MNVGQQRIVVRRASTKQKTKNADRYLTGARCIFTNFFTNFTWLLHGSADSGRLSDGCSGTEQWFCGFMSVVEDDWINFLFLGKYVDKLLRRETVDDDGFLIDCKFYK